MKDLNKDCSGSKELTWVPGKNEIELIYEVLKAIDEYNMLKRKLSDIYK